MTEYLDILDATGRVTGLTAPRDEIHGETPYLHQSVNIWIVNRPFVLLQQRGDEKRPFPGLWSASVGGHPQPGEELRAAGRRELREELGSRLAELVHIDNMRYLGTSLAREYCEKTGVRNNEFRHIFRLDLEGNLPLEFSPLEVKAVKYVPLDDLPQYGPGGAYRSECLPYTEEYFSLLLEGLRKGRFHALAGGNR